MWTKKKKRSIMKQRIRLQGFMLRGKKSICWKQKQGIYYMWNLKRSDTDELTYKAERDSVSENKLMVVGVEGYFGKVMYTLIYLKWITNKDWRAQGTLLGIMCQAGWKGGWGENGSMYVYGWVPLLFTSNYHNVVHRLYPNTKCFWC